MTVYHRARPHTENVSLYWHPAQWSHEGEIQGERYDFHVVGMPQSETEQKPARFRVDHASCDKSLSWLKQEDRRMFIDGLRTALETHLGVQVVSLDMTKIMDGGN